MSHKGKSIEDISGGQIVLYQNNLEVKLMRETVWLTQKQMSALFDKDSDTIGLHLKNIYKERELEESATTEESSVVQTEGKRSVHRKVRFYNLDAIISIGYRVNSKRGTQFRIWATNVLRKHLVEGYTLNQKRLEAQVGKIKELQETVSLLSNVVALESISDETKGIIQIISEYSRGLGILDDYDHERLSMPGGTRRKTVMMTYEDAQEIITAMKSKFHDSALVGREKDNSFKSSIGAIYQTFDGKDLYPTLEEKAAHLLYFVTKNHGFVDGNKRIAAAMFISFLHKNKILLRKDGSKRIDDNALAALTLMVAASKPSEKYKLIKVILNLMHE
ncbi:MAG: virulence protein RhuM/Fic/DOC family protein [Smithellaceae bacterium]|nr:virulence protein RhuM/Fic/DOC family protein [Smithellaceae bacterium]